MELYEALKKDVSEEAARMIAEVVPKASDLATRGDVGDALTTLRLEMRQDFADLRSEMRQSFADTNQRISTLETTMERRFAERDRQIFRYAMIFVGPLWVAMAAGLVRIVLKI